jgi:undecaprenyl-diphosphatase
MKMSAQDLVFMAAPLFLLLWFWPGTEPTRASNQRIAAITALSVFTSLALASAIGHLVSEPRPFISDLSTRLLISHSADNSFPSDHTTLAFAVSGALLSWRRTLGVVVFVIAVLIGIARIYVGVHWPSDILGAAVIGLVSGLSLAQVAPLLIAPQRRLARVLPSMLVAAP